jgi:hypothetical protein
VDKRLDEKYILQEMFPVYLGSVCRVKRHTTGSKILSRTLESRRYARLGAEVAVTSRTRVSTHWQSDGASVSMLAEDMSRNKGFSTFDYHIFYVLYTFVTYLLTLSLVSLRQLISEFVMAVRKQHVKRH